MLDQACIFSGGVVKPMYALAPLSKFGPNVFNFYSRKGSTSDNARLIRSVFAADHFFIFFCTLLAGDGAPGPDPPNFSVPHFVLPCFLPSSICPSRVLLSIFVPASGASLNKKHAPDGYHYWAQLVASAPARTIRRLKTAPPCSTFRTTSCSVGTFELVLRGGGHVQTH